MTQVKKHAEIYNAFTYYAGVGFAHAENYEKPLSKKEPYVVNYNGFAGDSLIFIFSFYLLGVAPQKNYFKYIAVKHWGPPILFNIKGMPFGMLKIKKPLIVFLK